ncbi:MAG: DUF1926 domain-containing protein [Nitrospiraceae bacterium]|nr:DUF1926 domain-containing protein [Nitrospiraceae bacterium]
MAKLLFGVHNHQPVENFHSIVDEAIEKAYKPFIEVAYQHSDFKFSIHFSGWLLEYIDEKHADLIDILKRMSRRGQVEFFTGGYYEPILVSLPSRWRRYQVEKLSDFVEELFGQRPKGLWLAERVWDDSIICDIIECGIEYVVVDDYHFICAGFDRKELGGYFVTESGGKMLKVFPIDKRLRYLIPFKPIESSRDYIKSQWGTRVLFDDGEKFGIWPGTYEWVYRKGWLESFFRMVKDEGIKTELFRENVESEKPLGIVYLPTSSYYEMGEWALPTERFRELKEFEAILDEKGLETYREKFVRGSIWKNFFVKYPESNYMHKRMITLSSRGSGKDFEENIAKSQCNDVFWHGIFGGIYLPNLRDNFWRFLLSAQNEADREKEYVKTEDLNLDGYDEGILSTDKLFAVVVPKGGNLCEMSLRESLFNYQNVMSRHREGYHYILSRKKPKEVGKGILTIHEMVPKLSRDVREKLIFDWHVKNSFISHFTDYVNPDLFKRESFKELSDFVDQPYSLALKEKRVIAERDGGIYRDGKFKSFLRKVYGIDRNRLVFEEEFRTDYRKQVIHILELNIHFIDPKGFKLKVWRDSLFIEDLGLKKVLRLKSSIPFDLLHYPIETVNQRESGVEVTVQGHCFGLCFPFSRSLSLKVELEVSNV